VSDHNHVPVVGVVGGIGSGKSAVCRLLAESRGKVVINGDEIGHQVLKITSVQDQIRQRFGNSVFSGPGEINRGALGRKVFGPSEKHRRARAELESIVHPKIREGIIREIAQARSQGGVEAVLLDAAVLLEAKWDDLCDAVVFVDVPESLRLDRVMRSRGWTEEDFRKREASQRSLAVKKARADGVVDNSGTVEDAAARLEQFVQQLIKGPRNQIL
jgi:dephospho-CoA kinase